MRRFDLKTVLGARCLLRIGEGGISDKVSYSKNSSELNDHSTVQTPQNSIDMQS